MIPTLLIALLFGSAASDPVERPRILIEPSVIHIQAGGDPVTVMVLHEDALGRITDITSEAEIQELGTRALSWSGALRLRADHPGTWTIEARLGVLKTEALVMASPRADTSPSWCDDIIPRLARIGCSSGGCHGAESGKGGFKLSLLGDDPGSDHLRITLERRARRVDREHPEESLLLRKPTLRVAHGGGRRLEVGDATHEAIVQWLAAGAPSDLSSATPIQGLDIHPRELLAGPATQSVRFVARARYANGAVRDVTDLAMFSSNDPTVFEVDESGQGRFGRAGETVVMARFRGEVAVARVARGGRPPAEPRVFADDDPIDQATERRLARLGEHLHGPTDDYAFLRRLTHDLLGRFPTLEEIRAFENAPSGTRRDAAIETMLADAQSSDRFVLGFLESLHATEDRLGEKGLRLLADFLRQSLVADRDLGEVVRDLLVAEGSTLESGPPNFWKLEREPTAQSELTAQAFFGVRIQCAQCHHHPFDRWTEQDHRRFTAIFATVAKRPGKDPREEIIAFDSERSLRDPRSGRPVRPGTLGGAEPAPKQDPRHLLASLPSPLERDLFDRHIVNIVVSRFFGRGLVDPIDDVRASNPSLDPALHDELAKEFRTQGRRLWPLVRRIVRTRTYAQAQRSSPETGPPWAGAMRRQADAEAVFSAIGALTGRALPLPGAKRGASPVTHPGTAGLAALDLFGRAPRLTSCACERTHEPLLRQSLHLSHATAIEERLRDPDGRVARRTRAEPDDRQLISEWYLLAFSRPPTPTELNRATKARADVTDRAAFFEDLTWVLINLPEFVCVP